MKHCCFQSTTVLQFTQYIRGFGDHAV